MIVIALRDGLGLDACFDRDGGEPAVGEGRGYASSTPRAFLVWETRRIATSKCLSLRSVGYQALLVPNLTAGCLTAGSSPHRGMTDGNLRAGKRTQQVLADIFGVKYVQTTTVPIDRCWRIAGYLLAVIMGDMKKESYVQLCM